MLCQVNEVRVWCAMKIRVISPKIALVVVSAAALAVLSACGGGGIAAQTTPPPFTPPVTTTTAPPPATSTVVVDGAILFTNTCGHCHDITEVAAPLSSMSASDLLSFINAHNGVGGSLTAAQRTALVNYLQSNCADDG